MNLDGKKKILGSHGKAILGLALGGFFWEGIVSLIWL